MPDSRAVEAERLAQRFHETYEQLAPRYGYETRKASAVPWAKVPERNRRLMVAVCTELLLTEPSLATSTAQEGEAGSNERLLAAAYRRGYERGRQSDAPPLGIGTSGGRRIEREARATAAALAEQAPTGYTLPENKTPQDILDRDRAILDSEQALTAEPDGREAVSADDLAQAIDGVPPEHERADATEAADHEHSLDECEPRLGGKPIVAERPETGERHGPIVREVSDRVPTYEPFPDGPPENWPTEYVSLHDYEAVRSGLRDIEDVLRLFAPSEDHGRGHKEALRIASATLWPERGTP